MSKQQKKLHLALQGGGAHGAYTWGILDKLLEDGRVDFDGICATSAGSMNAVVLSYGRMKNGSDGARQAMHDFWQKISHAGNPFGSAPSSHPELEKKIRNFTHTVMDGITRLISPYQFNPLNLNVLRDIVSSLVDFDELKKCNNTRLFLSTTNVRTGKVRVFNTPELSLDVVMASACLPYLFQAVKIGNDYYWDGGFMGNPAIFPLFYHSDTCDVMIVHINPMVRKKVPTTSSEIVNRINEITFNSSLLAEFRAVAFVNKLLESGWIKDEFKKNLKHILVHSIRADEALHNYDVSSKFDTHWHFLTNLRDLGRSEAETWLAKNYKNLGKTSTTNLENEFLKNGSNII